ncbi:hypothetical protein HHI36_006138 [Cryptolaemus montrouzieri]|uniref:Uncharacterized protein n=1 Tax=Cryptolaemus montrouzieri TaxID=559131 RepID=A0ABD2NXM7_9CUCU
MYLVKIPEMNNVIWKRHLNPIRNVYSANSNSPSVTSHDEESMSDEVSEVKDRIDDRGRMLGYIVITNAQMRIGVCNRKDSFDYRVE